MQRCGLCSLLSSLLRRAMCVGSRRGSGESYYQELAETTVPDIPTMESVNDNSYNRKAIPYTITTTTTTTTASGTTITTTTSIVNRRMSDTDRDRPLIEAIIVEMNTLSPKKRHVCNGRFLTMHKRRRKKLQTRSLMFDPAILDDILHGQVQCILEQVGNWKFNAFTLETVTGGRSLPVLCVHLFHWYGLLDHFNLDVVRVWKLFSLIEEGYHSTNPYHNSIHATDVTQAMHCFLQETKIIKHLEPLEIMASLIGAVTHDLDHPGVNQPFLIATSNHLAALYENTSVLENHHWRSAIGCLLESGVAEQIQHVRPELEKQISSLILATDITRQQEFIETFKDFLNNNTLKMENAEHRHFILQIALKCADISNPCRPWDISKKWSLKVCEEFYRQGDYERQLNLPVTSLCDRQSTSVPKIQTGFFKFVVSPLMVEWHRFLKTELSYRMMRHLKYNEKQWDLRMQAELAEETRTEISDAEVLDDDDIDDFNEEEQRALDLSDSSEVLMPEIKLPRRSSLQVPTFSGGSHYDRRLSVPIQNVPKIILPPRDHGSRIQTLVDPFHERDENKIDNDSLSILSSDSESGHRAKSSIDSAENERPLSAENLLPNLSIASMTDSVCADKLNIVMHGTTNFPNMSLLGVGSKQLIRQQTFPPLQPYVRARYMSSTAELGTCPEALLESRSGSSTSSPDNENYSFMRKKESHKREQDPHGLDKSNKLFKLSIAPGQKENLDPSIHSKNSIRRRGSAPVTIALPTKCGEQDLSMSFVIKKNDNIRRGSVPTEIVALNTNEYAGQSEISNFSVISGNFVQRRGSVPSETSSVMVSTGRNNNSKRRNPRKVLCRRSSSGAEILTPIVKDVMDADSSNGASGSESAWYRFKKDVLKRKDSDYLTKRRGSLPAEVLSVGLGTLRH